jgi:hypothetical protein
MIFTLFHPFKYSIFCFKLKTAYIHFSFLMGVNLGGTEDSRVKDSGYTAMKSQIQLASTVITHPIDSNGTDVGMDDGLHC